MGLSRTLVGHTLEELDAPIAFMHEDRGTITLNLYISAVGDLFMQRVEYREESQRDCEVGGRLSEDPNKVSSCNELAI